MAQKGENIHDKFVKESFSDPERAGSFLETFLPEDLAKVLDLQKIVVKHDSYLTEELKMFFSDLIFEVPLREKNAEVEIILLFEHKSSPDEWVVFQVANYVFSHWIKCISNKEKIKPIIPIIYYQGKARWQPVDIKKCFQDYSEEILTYLPKVPYVYLPLHQMDEKSILNMSNSLMISAIMAQRTRIEPMRLAQDLVDILRLFPHREANWNFFQIMVVYLSKSSDLPRDYIIEALTTFSEPLKSQVMTTYDQIKLEGKLEGLAQAQKDLVLKAVENDLKIGIISNITGLSEEQIEAIIDQSK